MSIAVIIAEFNPFHNGHAHLLSEALKLCDRAVVVMSGPFVQRGEPAIMDKHRRARAALDAGASLVVELPVIYALSPAEIFARGAVLTANALLSDREGTLVFGSESGDPVYLQKLAGAISSQDDSFRDKLTDALSSGMSYPKAMDSALSSSDEALFSEYPLADRPNDILAAEYIRSLAITESSIKSFPIKRTDGSDITHASDIRKKLQGSDISAETFRERVTRFLPECSAREFIEVLKSDAERTVRANDLSDALGYALLAASPEHLRNISDMNTDLANRILSLRRDYEDFTGFVHAVKTKAFTYARISRCLSQLLLSITKDDRAAALEHDTTYLRVLGVREDSRDLLSMGRGESSVKAPLIMRGQDFHSEQIKSNPVLERMIELQLFADSIYDHCRLRAGSRVAEEEKPPVII